MVFGHKLARLVTVHLTSGLAKEEVLTLSEFAKRYPDETTKSDFERLKVTEYFIWTHKRSGLQFTVVNTDSDKQDFLRMLDQRKSELLSNSKAASAARIRRKRKFEGATDEQD